jgi:hypothetical protein
MKLFTYKYTTMPRLSLYKPEKGNDFKFLDRVIEEQFQVGGVDVFVHKYVGPDLDGNPDNTPGTTSQTSGLFDELSIQDVILMENRDRKYDEDIYVMRGIYQMQDLDFNLSQFGIFLNNDNIFMHFHLRNCVGTLGRKIMAGDVIELPHLKDEYALDDSSVALKRFYVVQDVTRAASGFSQTWYPHLLRVKCVPLVDTQEYADILDNEIKDTQGNPAGSLRDLISTYNQNIAINEQIIAQAEADAPLSGYETQQMYVMPLKADGTLDLQDASDMNADASIDGHTADASSIYKSPQKDMYVGYLTGDGRPPNGAPYSFGISFPTDTPVEGQFHLRTDYFPNRLFRWNGTVWMKYEDNVRMTMTNAHDLAVPNRSSSTSTYTTENRQTQRVGFVNNNNTATIAGAVVPERQALSKILKPRADN